MVERSVRVTREETEKDVQKLKDHIVEQLKAAQVSFPIRSKDELARIYPKGTPESCTFLGRKVSIHDIIPSLDESSFPINSAEDAADLLAGRCVVLYPEIA